MLKLSIITVNKNNAKGLQKTIESVVGQSFRDFEFIVIDGNSDDGSKKIIDDNRKHFSYAVSEGDTGVYNAMNKGIQNSKGEYLLFLNSGDWLNNKDVVSRVLPQLKDYDVISGDIDIYDNEQWHHITSEDKVSVNYFLRISLYHQATFVSRSLFNKYGNYNEEFRSTGDYEFFIRTLLKHGASYHHINNVISNFVADGMSNDPKWEAVNTAERKRSWELNFSEPVLKEIDFFNQLINSKEVKWGKRIINRLPFLKKD